MLAAISARCGKSVFIHPPGLDGLRVSEGLFFFRPALLVADVVADSGVV
jgi:hypothetical protein